MSTASCPAGQLPARRIAGAVVLSLGIHAAVLGHLTPFAAPDLPPQRPPLTVDVLLKAIQKASRSDQAPQRREAPRVPSESPQPRPLRNAAPGPSVAPPAATTETVATAAAPVPSLTPERPPGDRSTPADRPAPTAPPPDLDALAGQYGKQVADLLIARKRYPRLAQMRGWQGRVEVEARFSPGGRLGQIVITRSSGHETLDAAALELLQGAELPPPPAMLTQADFRLRLPIEYRLQN